ncbi:MAG: fused MFS/spermidine synthase [Rickettsiales bacterium]|nr:fused MFS/spermidine synthase [Rickettsiales bacterium]
MNINKNNLLLLVIFLEGYIVLACELLAIRQLIPFAGSGTEVISIIISAVLLPLALGYHVGGAKFRKVAAKRKASGLPPLSIRRILLRNALLSMAFLTMALSYPFLELLFGVLSALDITHRIAQVSLYCALFLVGPVYVLGQTVPLISNYFSKRDLSSITGTMLFCSTTGSFLGSVFSTIILMSFIGVHNTVIVTMGLLGVLALLLTRRNMRYEPLLIALLFVVTLAANNNFTMRELNIVSNNNYNMVMVTHAPNSDDLYMFVNRSGSSKLAKNNANRFPYVNYIETNFIDTIPLAAEPKNILVLGAGGFTIGLNDKKNHYLFVDIDKDLKPVSEHYFLKQKLSANKRFEALSARAFLRNNQEKFDLVIIDVFTNMHSVPMECTTREFLDAIKTSLKPDGMVIANMIASPTFNDYFSVRYDNSFASVFPNFSRQVVTPFDPWLEKNHKEKHPTANILYIYYNRLTMGDTAVYTDNQNTYSLDR